MNNNCGFYQDALKKKKAKNKQRWKILSAYLSPDSYVERTYCPHCKWELKIGLFIDNETNKVDEKPLSAIELIRQLDNAKSS